jgi:putative selenate reductase
VNQKAYDVNISFTGAADMIKRLQIVAAKNKKTIGVKFGNTLEVVNTGTFLKEKVKYLSGQPLHLLHLALVQEWRKEFGGDFPVSFSAGVDANNFADCVAIGLVPVTTCTDLLRPGGYGRLQQYLLNLEKRMKQVEATTIEEFIIATASLPEPPNLKQSIERNTAQLLEQSLSNTRYHASNNAKAPRKIGSHLHLWDCINCDKCIPVCPNDANFYFEVEPVEIMCDVVDVSTDGWKTIRSEVLSIKERHQIGNFADACNECGNCDVFCPEDGGPYIEKPRFFGSLEQYRKWSTHSGFFMHQDKKSTTLYGRFKKQEFVLNVDEETRSARFGDQDATVTIDRNTSEVIESHLVNGKTSTVIDLRFYHTMAVLMKGIQNTNRVHFVNIPNH